MASNFSEGDEEVELSIISGCPVDQEVTPECEISFEEGGDCDGKMKNCPKNGEHLNFIPALEFGMKHLPPEHQTQRNLDAIKHRSALTVRVLARHTSKNRPNTFADSKSSYPYSKFKGSNKFRRYGTGHITLIHPKKKEFQCPCLLCQKGKPKTGYWMINVRTATHVIFDQDEVPSAEFDCFYDSDDRTGVKTIYGCSMIGVQTPIANMYKNDICDVICVTHEIEIVSRLISYVGYDNIGMFDMNLFDTPALTHVVISHPHGCSKRITVGNIIHLTVPLGRDYQSNTPFPFMEGTRCRLPLLPWAPFNDGKEHDISDLSGTQKKPQGCDEPLENAKKSGCKTASSVDKNDSDSKLNEKASISKAKFSNDLEGHCTPNDVKDFDSNESVKKKVPETPNFLEDFPIDLKTIFNVMNEILLLQNKELDFAKMNEHYTKMRKSVELQRYLAQNPENEDMFLNVFGTFDDFFQNDVDEHGSDLAAGKSDRAMQFSAANEENSNVNNINFSPQPGTEFELPPGMTFTLPEGAEYAFRYYDKNPKWFVFPPGTQFALPGGEVVCMPYEAEFTNEFLIAGHSYLTYDMDTCPGSSGACVNILDNKAILRFSHMGTSASKQNRSGVRDFTSVKMNMDLFSLLKEVNK